MTTNSPIVAMAEITADLFTTQSSRQEILEQLDRIIGSSNFRNSKRYPSLLRYIVEETVAGRADFLKERTLGLCVFDRSADYDTNLDPVVRVSAGEVRKRIAQYYQASGHEHELRIEIPLGSYIPRFYRPTETGWSSQQSQAAEFPFAQEEESGLAVLPLQNVLAPTSSSSPVYPSTAPEPLDNTPRRSRSSIHLVVLYTLLLLSICSWGLSAWRESVKARPSPSVALFWQRILASPAPTLIVLGVHSFDSQGNDISAISHASRPQPQQTLLSAMTRSDMVHLSDVTSYGSVTALLTNHVHTFRTQGAADTTLEQLQQSPFVLIGGFNNFWTTHLSQKLRFRFVTLNGPHGLYNVIQDSQHPETIWTLDTSQSALSNSRDYGLVSCFLDSETEQYVIMAGGIGKSGTEAATDFLANEKELDSWLKRAPPQSGSNVQIVVATDVIEGKHGPPHVTGFYRW